MTYSKKKRLVDRQVYEECTLDWCEWCGGPAYGGPHHVITRGSGGPDLKENLIQLCAKCHRNAHFSLISKLQLLKRIAMRERLTVQQVIERIEKAMGRGIKIDANG